MDIFIGKCENLFSKFVQCRLIKSERINYCRLIKLSIILYLGEFLLYPLLKNFGFNNLFVMHLLLFTFFNLVISLIFSKFVDTEIKLSVNQLKLSESEEAFKKLADMMPEAIVEIDRNYTISFANKQAYRMFGLNGNTNLKDINVLNFFTNEKDKDRALKISKDIFENKSVPTHREYLLNKPNGEKLWVSTSSISLRKNNGVTGYRAILRDITKEKLKIEERKKEMLLELHTIRSEVYA